MRELARQKSQTVVITRDSGAADHTEVNTVSPKQFFHGWLREVPPRRVNPRLDQELPITRISTLGEAEAITRVTTANMTAAPVRYKRGILTIREMLSVNRATVRESDAHRHWPTDVVLKFMAADVVTRKEKLSQQD